MRSDHWRPTCKQTSHRDLQSVIPALIRGNNVDLVRCALLKKRRQPTAAHSLHTVYSEAPLYLTLLEIDAAMSALQLRSQAHMLQEECSQTQTQQPQPQSGRQQVSFIICGGPTDALTTAARREVRSQAAKRVSCTVPAASFHVVDPIQLVRRSEESYHGEEERQQYRDPATNTLLQPQATITSSS